MKAVDTEKIWELIRKNDKTQIELAKFVGLSKQNFILRMKKGDFWTSHLIKISQYLNVSPSDLINKDYLLNTSYDKRNYIKNRLKIIFDDLADTISMTVNNEVDKEDSSDNYNDNINKKNL